MIMKNLNNDHFGCGHTRKKALFPVRSTLVKFPRAILSSVVGDHMRNYGAAIFFLFLLARKHFLIRRKRAENFSRVAAYSQ